MADALSVLSSATTGANALSGLLLVTPQSTVGYRPQTGPATASSPAVSAELPSILFHYEGEQTTTIESDVTDHYAQDNVAIQDHIAIKPVMITTQGYIGELNDVPPNAAFALAQKIANKLTNVVAYVPGLSATALIAYNEAVFLYQTASNLKDAAVSAWNSLTGGPAGTSIINGTELTVSPNQTKQQKAFQQFYGYHAQRTLFTVQTPWAIFQNMVIKSLRAVQDPDTNVITDFEVTFKQMRFASSDTTASTSRGSTGRLLAQKAGGVNLGTSTPVQSTVSLSSAISGVA